MIGPESSGPLPAASRRTLRQFAGLCLVVFGGFAGLASVRGRMVTAIILAGLALALASLGLARPEAIRPVFVAWMNVARPIGSLVSRGLLACLFYGLFTPMGLLLRLVGHDPLRLRRGAAQETYWQPRPSATDVGSYFRQS